MYNRFCALSTDAGPPALRAGRLDQTGSLKELKELNYLDSQHAFVSRNQSACSACVPLVSAAYTAWTNTTDKKGAAAKKNLKNKANSPLTCDLRRRKGAAPCAYTRFKQTLRLHYLCRGPPPAPICGRWKPLQRSRHIRHHSLASYVPLSGDCWRKKENRSIHLPWVWQVIFTRDEIWVVPAYRIP